MQKSKFTIGTPLRKGTLVVTLVEDVHIPISGVNEAMGLGNDGNTYRVVWSRIDSKHREIDWDNPEFHLVSDNE